MEDYLLYLHCIAEQSLFNSCSSHKVMFHVGVSPAVVVVSELCMIRSIPNHNASVFLLADSAQAGSGLYLTMKPMLAFVVHVVFNSNEW